MSYRHRGGDARLHRCLLAEEKGRLSMAQAEQPARSQNGKKLRVFVVEDHAVVRLGLKTMIESEDGICVVGMASSGEEALELAPNTEADVVLMDLRMPGMDGLETIAALRRRIPEIRIIVLTNYHSDEDVFNAVQAGAMAYLLKSATLEEVVCAIRTVDRGERYLPPTIATQLASRLSRTPISTRELEILRLVAQGLTNPEIAEILHISDKTVRNHVINCLDKLGAKDRTEAAILAIRRGFVALEN